MRTHPRDANVAIGHFTRAVAKWSVNAKPELNKEHKVMRRVLFAVTFAMSGLTVHAANTVALYEFNNSLNPVPGVGSAAATALVQVDPLGLGAFQPDTVNGVDRTVYRFDGLSSPATSQGGLQFVNADLMDANAYSIEAYFSFDSTSGWRRIIDTKDRSEDTGFYVLSGGLQLYPSNVGTGTFLPDTYNHVILTFNGSTAVAYLDGVAQSTQATDYYSLPASNVISLFLDNTAGPAQTEYSAGKIAWARFYDGALTAEEAMTAYQAAVGFEVPPPVPEPGTYALLAGGLAVVAVAVRRRRA